MTRLSILAATATLALSACSNVEHLRASDGETYECRQYMSRAVWWDKCDGPDQATAEYRAIKAGE